LYILTSSSKPFHKLAPDVESLQAEPILKLSVVLLNIELTPPSVDSVIAVSVVSIYIFAESLLNIIT